MKNPNIQPEIYPTLHKEDTPSVIRKQSALQILNLIRQKIEVSVDDVEKAWYKCKQISIILPECECFHWFKINFCISDEKFSKVNLEEKLKNSPELKKMLYDKDSLFKWLNSINEIMKYFELPMDSTIKYDDSWWRMWWFKAINFIKELVKGNKQLKWLESASFWLNNSTKIDENNIYQACINGDWNIDYIWELKSAYMLFK